MNAIFFLKEKTRKLRHRLSVFSFFLKNRNVLWIATITFLISCEDFIQVDSPKTQLISKTVFENDLTAQAAVASLYVELTATSGNFTSITALAGFASDELNPFVNSVEYQQIHENSIMPTNSLITGLWGNGYANIYRANAIIEGLANSSKINSVTKAQLEGEAKFIRAFLHFYLVNLFGAVPYIKATDYRANNRVSRMTEDEVYSFIIADLVDSQNLLTETYVTTERVRANKWAATALLSRVYLFKGDWAKAEEQSTAVISNNAIYYLDEIDNVFLKNSNEAILQLVPVLPNRNTNDGQMFILRSAPTFAALRDEFIETFESDDLRKDHWIGTLVGASATWYFPFKYKIKTGADPLNEYSMVLRLAEQYLIRAEAKARQGKLSEAIADLDSIRDRAGLPLLSDTNPLIDQSDLLLAIEHERRVELFTEWGHRWFDLKRTDRAVDVLDDFKTDFVPEDLLFPIPESEVLVNPNLKPQNPGY